MTTASINSLDAPGARRFRIVGAQPDSAPPLFLVRRVWLDLAVAGLLGVDARARAGAWLNRYHALPLARGSFPAVGRRG